MKRRIDLLTIHNLQQCLEGKPKRYITIRKVPAHKEKRLSETQGNVNLTSLWFEMMNVSQEQEAKYTCQFIGLLSDEEEKDEFWNKLSGKSVGIGLLKIRRDVGGKENQNEPGIKDQIRGALGEKGRVFRTFDNADYVVVYYEENDEKLKKIGAAVKSVKINKSSAYFSYYFVYGKMKEKANFFEMENYELEEDEYIEQHEFQSAGICTYMSEKIKRKMEECCKKKNKKKAAYFQALLVVVNILAQYEQNPPQKYLFYLLYPQLELFWSQFIESEGNLETIKEKIGQEENWEKKKKLEKQKHGLDRLIEKSFSDFLDAMEELLHHIGPSYKNEFNAQFYGGMLYDIPIGLSMMYISYMDAVTEVLNHDIKDLTAGANKRGSDSDARDFEYRYCLVPVAYSRPITTYFDFGLSPQNRLVKVMISRPMMLMVRPLLVVLAHEVSHYVGERCRKERAGAVISMLSYYLAEELMEVEAEFFGLEDEEREFLESYVQEKKTSIFLYLADELRTRVRAGKNKYNGTEEEYYFFNNLQTVLLKSVTEVLYDYSNRLQNTIEEVEDGLLVQLRKKKNVGKLSRKIEQIQKKVKRKLRELEFKNNISEFWEDMKYELKESYADLSAIKMLEIEAGEYLETFVTAESFIPDDDTINLKLINRVAMVHEILSKEKKWKLAWDRFLAENEETKDETKAYLVKLQKNVNSYLGENENSGLQKQEKYGSSEKASYFECADIVDEEKKYLELCYQKLSERLEECEKTPLELIRDLYQNFKVYGENQDCPIEDLFEDYDNLIEHYQNKIKKMHQDHIDELSKKKASENCGKLSEEMLEKRNWRLINNVRCDMLDLQ